MTNNGASIVLSFYDVTGEAVKPWADNGYECYIFDIQHPTDRITEYTESGGSITKVYADLHDEATWLQLERIHSCAYTPNGVALVMGFPVCTDLAVSGAKHWEKKRLNNPQFQHDAVGHAVRIKAFADYIDAPYMIENPVGALSTMWRKPDFYFHPYEYGGYITNGDATHPTYPDHIAPSDAYHKKTGIWCGNGFIIPVKYGVEPMPRDKFGMSKQFSKLGGKSAKTKNIRSATPRGFAKAVHIQNGV